MKNKFNMERCYASLALGMLLLAGVFITGGTGCTSPGNKESKENNRAHSQNVLDDGDGKTQDKTDDKIGGKNDDKNGDKTGGKTDKKNGSKTNPATAEVIPVRVITLAPENYAEYGEYYGEVSGIQEAQILNRSGGRVEKIRVKTGDTVKIGDSLASIDSRKALNQLNTARLNERMAREEWERQQRFLVSGNTSQLIVDRAHLAWLSTQSASMQAEENYEGALCITPITGQVIASSIEEYKLIPPNTLAFVVADLSQLRIVIGVPETDLGSIKPGDTVELGFAMYPDKSWKGSVYSLGKKVTTGTVTFPVEIRMANTEHLLLSGVVATVKIIRTQFTNQIVVPGQAVLSEGNVHYVMLVDGKAARKRTVSIGYTGETKSVITSGLAAGERLVVEGQGIVADGTPVKVVE